MKVRTIDVGCKRRRQQFLITFRVDGKNVERMLAEGSRVSHRLQTRNESRSLGFKYKILPNIILLQLEMISEYFVVATF